MSELAGVPKSEELLNIDYQPPHKGWMDTPVNFKPGTYSYAAASKNLKILDMPFPIDLIDRLDTLFTIGVPALCLTDVIIVAAITHLFLRRVLVPKMRYLSLPADYFPLFLLLSIVGSGLLMRHIYKVDLIKVKELALSLISFHPVLPEGIGTMFYIHLFFVCLFIAYFPFSKLMHMGGVFLSPTRNLANNNRAKRHINPWNYPVKVHTYEEYEDEFREKMKTAEIPVDKE